MTEQELIRKFDITESGRYTATGFVPDGKLRIANTRSLTPESLEEIKAKKQDIIKVLTDCRIAKAAETEKRKAAIAAIDGLAEIKAAIADLNAWEIEFERSFEDVGGLGVRAKPEYDIKAMRAAHPRADAYLKAENEAMKTNDELAAIGKKALEEVIFGDWKKAMEQMERDEDAFVAAHIWD